MTAHSIVLRIVGGANRLSWRRNIALDDVCTLVLQCVLAFARDRFVAVPLRAGRDEAVTDFWMARLQIASSLRLKA